jgi:hypothetical protein
MFIADGVNSVLLNRGASFFRISIFVRSVAQIYFILVLLRAYEGRKRLRGIFLFYVLFLIGFGAYAITTPQPDRGSFFANFVIVNKILFFFIVFETFRLVYKTAESKTRLFRLFEALVLLQAIVIVLSFVLKMDVFAAYSYVVDGEIRIVRFGYQGLIPAQNEVSAFFLIAFFYYLIKFDTQRQGAWELPLVTIAAMLTGTKVALILPVILAIYLMKWLLQTHPQKSSILLGTVILVFLGYVFLNWQQIVERLAPTINYYARRQQESASPSIIDIVASGRVQKIRIFFHTYLPRFNVLNYLFGGVWRSHFIK